MSGQQTCVSAAAGPLRLAGGVARHRRDVPGPDRAGTRSDDLGVRWVAVRRADDHVHVVATLARQDGRRVFPRNDCYRAGEASRAVEATYGLTVTCLLYTSDAA